MSLFRNTARKCRITCARKILFLERSFDLREYGIVFEGGTGAANGEWSEREIMGRYWVIVVVSIDQDANLASTRSQSAHVFRQLYPVMINFVESVHD